MPDHLELAKSVLGGSVDWLCPRMELRSCPSRSEPIWTGCGLIRADGGGRLKFRFSGTFPFPVPKQLRPYRTHGKMYATEDHVTLWALDSENRQWRTDPILVHVDHPGEILHGSISRHVPNLIHERERQDKDVNTARMCIPLRAFVPLDRSSTFTRRAGERLLEQGWALDHHIRQIGDTEVTFQVEEKIWLVVTAKRKDPLPQAWLDCMHSALEFAIAGPMRPVLIALTDNKSEYIGLMSGPFDRQQSSLPRPIAEIGPHVADPFWGLVEKFFVYVWNRRDHEIQMLEELAAIRTAASLSLQTASLTLAIGIEAIARETLPHVPPVGWSTDDLRSLLDHLSHWTGDDATKRRAIGMLRGKSEPRVADALYAWADRSGTSRSIIDAWKLLRHPAAHGARVHHDQAQWDRYYAVVELLYRIVTSAIGYSGPILETSKPGWGSQ